MSPMYEQMLVMTHSEIAIMERKVKYPDLRRKYRSLGAQHNIVTLAVQGLASATV